MPVTSNWATGRRNVLASVVHYLQTQIPGETIKGSPYLQTADFPTSGVVTVEDLGLFSLGDQAYGDVLKNDGLNNLTKGKIEQTQLEINIASKMTGDKSDPVRVIRKLHDEVYQAFAFAGITLPVIRVLDFENEKADTGAKAWHPTELDNVWIPTLIKDDGTPAVFRYRIYCRIFWEMYYPA